MKAITLFCILIGLLVGGCVTAPTSIPLHDTGSFWMNRTEGIPYYLPRPYLVISKNFSLSQMTATKETVPSSGGSNKTTQVANTVKTTVTPMESTNVDTFAWQIIYLPDLNQKYGLRFKRGTGTQENSFTLVDGWKLTGVNTKSDAKTAETIAAVGTTVKDIGSVLATAFLPVVKGAPLTKEQENLQALHRNTISKELKEVRSGIWVIDMGNNDDEIPKVVYTWTTDDTRSKETK